MAKKNVPPITGWEAAANQLEARGVSCTFFLGEVSVHPGKYEVLGLLEEATRVRARLRLQAHRHPTFPTALLCLIQTEFTESFHQALERHQMVCWPEFDQLQRALVTGNFRPENMAFYGLFVPPPPPANQ